MSNKYQGFSFAEEGRQHINLSPRTMEIIERDMIYFNDDYEKNNKSGFLNRVISHYYDQFPLSMDVALKQIYIIQNKLDGEKFEQKMTRRITEEINSEIMKNLINEFDQKNSSGIQFKLKLNKLNVSLLESLDEGQYFNEFAPRSGISFYLKALLESYAALTAEQRERVFFRDTIETVENAIKNHTLIQYNKNGQPRRLTPINIFRPHYQQTLVLLATEEKMNSDIARIFNDITMKELLNGQVRELKTKKGLFVKGIKISPDNLDVVESQKPTRNFTVRFTQSGLQRFILEEDRFPFVGIKSKDDEYIYTFTTTETHIFLHLFKYGGQAVIISPADVRDRFSRLYKASYEEYEESKTSEVIG